MENIGQTFTTRIMEKVTPYFDISDNLQTLEENLHVLTTKKSDIEAKVNNAELSGKKRKTMEVQSWLEKVKKFKDESDGLIGELKKAGFYKRLKKGSHVKELKDRVGEFIKQSESFRELVLDECETSRERLFTTQLHGEKLNQELDNILAWLKAESNQVPCIGIYGMGGVGKTTLARHIYSNLQGTSNTFHVFWVTVSHEVDIIKLQSDLSTEMELDLSKDNDVEVRAASLNRALIKRKNVVLILDDVWKYFDLEKIGILLRVNGCKVIITSQSRNVCNQMGCKKIIKVPPLSEEEAWKLFLEKLDHEYMLSPEVEEVAKKMAKKCDGLPFAIVTMARSMIRVDDIRPWRNALEELKQLMRHTCMKNEVLPKLLHSYNRLTDQRLQQCFLYCSLYPEDYKIPRDELISRFISEGMMHQRDSRAAEFDQGHTILDELVNVCLLESIVDSRGKQFVKMHDLLREMVVEITRNNPKFLRKARFQSDELLDEEEWIEDLDKASLMYNNIVEIPEGISPRCPRLSTLILSHNPLKLIPDSFFAYIRGLRTLDLRDTDIKKLPNSILDLENLTALLLEGCYKLCYVPSLRKLKGLMELDISRTGIKKVPEGMESLVKLKCLNVQRTHQLEEIPRGLLPRLPRLQRLLLPLHKKVQLEEVESLKLLEEFQGRVDVDIFYSKWFNKSPRFSFYRIVARGDNSFKDYYLEKYERGIILDRCSFRRSGGDVVLLPHNIQCLVFFKCKGLTSCLLEDVPSLYHSKDLQKCEMEGCDEIESILKISSTSNDDGPLQNLESLKLYSLPSLIGLIKWEPRALAALPPRGTFASLKNLEISCCNKMKKLFPQKLAAYNLQNLEKIKVFDCDQMEEIIADDEEDEAVGVGSISSSSNNNKYTNIIPIPRLRQISLFNLPELKSIYEGPINCCDSIRTIHIVNCPKIKRLPFFNPSVDEKSTISFPKLQHLVLCNLPEVKSICNGIMICDVIKSIKVRGCRQLRRLGLCLPLIDGQPFPPPSLEKILIYETEKEWWESLEWDHPNSNNVLHPFLKYFVR